MQLQRQIDQLLAQRAAQWHESMADADESTRAEFVRWLKKSPQHVDEYLRTVYLDRALEGVDRKRQENIELLLAEALPALENLSSPRPSQPTRRRFSNKRWRWAIAASLAACLLGWTYVKFGAVRSIELSTAIGEQRTIELADASLVALNVDTELQVRLKASTREIRLIHGEALFDVAHDPKRPFKVQTRNAVIQAIGTQFNVYERPDGSTRISVLEGAVKITAREVVNLRAGEEARVLPDGRVRGSNSANVSRSVAWRQRQLVFDEASLEEVVYEFNRYSRTTHVRLEGVPPGSHHYNGVFNGPDPQSLADLLAKERDLLVERTPGEIVIRLRLQPNADN